MNAERTVMKNHFTTTPGDQPILETPICKWMTERFGTVYRAIESGDPSVAELIARFLRAACEFDSRIHCLEEKDREDLELCVKHWFLVTPWFGEHPYEELFLRKIPNADKNCIPASEATTVLTGLTRLAGWIELPIMDSNTYYKIVGDRVYAKAQHILASRFICRISE